MATAKTKTKIKTSITIADADEHLDSGSIRSRIYCTYISGFHLIKLAKGCSWRYRYTDFEGKRREYTLPLGYPAMKPVEAAEKVTQFILDEVDPLKRREDNQEAEIQEKADRLERTLRKYLNGRYSKVMESWSYRTATENKQRIEVHYADLLDKPMDAITKQNIRTWQERVASKGLKHSTIKRAYSSLKALLNQAVKDEVIESNPIADHSLDAASYNEQQQLEKDKEIQKKEERRLLTQDEVEGLFRGLDLFAEELRSGRRNSRAHGKPNLADLDAVDYPHWFIPFCLFAFHTGQRPGDIRTMEWNTHLNLNFARFTKGTNKSQWVKRKDKDPTLVDVPLNSDIVDTMRKWWKQCGRPESGLVFTNPTTGRMLDKTGYRKAWLRVKALGGLDPDLDFYSLRHNFCSVLVAQGVPLFTVAKMVGHKDEKMISEHYGHLCPQKADQAVNLLSSQAKTGKGAKLA